MLKCSTLFRYMIHIEFRTRTSMITNGNSRIGMMITCLAIANLLCSKDPLGTWLIIVTMLPFTIQLCRVLQFWSAPDYLYSESWCQPSSVLVTYLTFIRWQWIYMYARLRYFLNKTVASKSEKMQVNSSEKSNYEISVVWSFFILYTEKRVSEFFPFFTRILAQQVEKKKFY